MTEPLIVRQLMKNKIKWLVDQGYNVTIICSPGGDVKWIRKQGANHIKLNFRRKISFLNDIKCLLKLIIILRKHKFDLIHYSTPKSSLLTPIAIKLGFVKSSNVYTVRGRVYENYTGFKKVFTYSLIFFHAGLQIKSFLYLMR